MASENTKQQVVAEQSFKDKVAAAIKMSYEGWFGGKEIPEYPKVERITSIEKILMEEEGKEISDLAKAAAEAGKGLTGKVVEEVGAQIPSHTERYKKEERKEPQIQRR